MENQTETNQAVDEQNIDQANQVDQERDTEAPQEPVEPAVEPETDNEAQDDAAEAKEPEVDWQERYSDTAKRLFREMVKNDGRLADPSDIEFDPEYLDNEDKLAEDIGELIKRKPGLKAMRFKGNAGAGKQGEAKSADTDLISIIQGML